MRFWQTLDFLTAEEGKIGKHDIFFKRVFCSFFKTRDLNIPQGFRETLGKNHVALKYIGK